jgi:hypothetical protein
MVDKAIQEALIERLDKLPVNQQRLVLRYATSLQATELPRGTPVKNLLRFAGTISREDGEAMLKAIEEGCEQVDPNEW